MTAKRLVAVVAQLQLHVYSAATLITKTHLAVKLGHRHLTQGITFILILTVQAITCVCPLLDYFLLS